MFASLRARLGALLFRGRSDAELDEELRYHLDREIERNVANGMSASDARDAARRAFGNVSVAAEQARDTARWRWLEETRQDLAYALRTFRRAPTFVFGVVATIGLGLGLLTTAFTLFDAYVLRPLSIRDPASLYTTNWPLTWTNYRRFTAENRVFSDVVGTRRMLTRVHGRLANGDLVTGNYFSVLGVRAELGRTIVDDDAAPETTGRALVLAYDTWASTFGADTSVVGAPLFVDGSWMTIVGVARRGFHGLGPVPMQFWAPITMYGLTDSLRIGVTGHLRAHVSEAQAVAAITRWIKDVVNPEERSGVRVSPTGIATAVTIGVRLTPMGTAVPLDNQAIVVFMPAAAAVVLVLLIACANVANMMLARGMARQREIGIRLALGAARLRLVRQLLTESLALALPCAVAALVVSALSVSGGTRLLLGTMPTFFAERFRLQPLGSDTRVFAFTAIWAVLAALAFGLVPAIQGTRPSVVHATRGDFDAPLRKSTLRSLLLLGQVTVSAMLLICAGVLLRSVRQASHIDAGIRTHGVVQIQARDSLRREAIDRLRDDRGVRALASASSPPLDNAFDAIFAGSSDSSHRIVHYNVVSPDYFSLLEIPIVRGRLFTADEARGGTAVVIVNQSAAAQFWPGIDPVGRTLVISSADAPRPRLRPFHRATVIAVARDALPGWLGRNRDRAVVFYPQRIDAPESYMLAAVTGSADVARVHLDELLTSADSNALQDIHTLDQAVDAQVYPYRLFNAIAWIVSVAALLLTLTGVYGVLAYLVAQRTRELGVRLALGASPRSLVALALRDTARLALIGLAIGAVLAAGVSRLFAHGLTSIDVYDPAGYAIGAAVVLVATAVAAFVPARRAAAVNPVEALRADS